MLNNYLKTAIRNLLKNKVYFFLNVFGLSIGLSGAFLLFYYTQDELSFDAFHEKRDRIYRITESFKNGDNYTATALSPYKIAPLIASSHPDVESFVRLDATMGRRRIEFGEIKHVENRLVSVDSNFFEVFDFQLLKGNPKTVLSRPNTVVIGDDIAAKYFGSADPIGKVLAVRNIYRDTAFNVEVTGIMKKMPLNSHFHKDFLFSMKTADQVTPDRTNSWGWTSQYSYLLLKEQAKISGIEPMLNQLAEEHAPDWFSKWAYFGLQPMMDIHLKSDLKDEIEAQGDISYVRIFTIIAIFLLLIACINYMNLATARSAERGKEVGLRKVVGAGKEQLIIQFLGESLIISSVAFLVTISMIALSLPFFESLSGKKLDLHLWQDPILLASLLGISVIVGLLAGIYPAFVMTRFKPIQALKEEFLRSRDNLQALLLRKGLVVFQFILSIALIIGTIVIYNQWEYLRHKKLGVNADQIIHLPINSLKMEEEYPVLKTQLLKVQGVNNVSVSSKHFTSVFSNFNTFTFNGKKFTFPVVNGDHDFFETYEIPMVEGRSFSVEQDEGNPVIIINETAAAQLGLGEDAVGSFLDYGNEEKSDLYKIVGISKDFHFESLHKKINPLTVFLSDYNRNAVVINVNTSQIQAAIADIKRCWEQFNFPGDFSFQFLNESLARQYTKEANFFKVFSIFSLLAIFIACLGLFGLVSYSTQQRTKEIGIRKVLGASVVDVVYLLNKELMQLLLLAFVIATPIAYYAMNQWLQSFAYSISIGLGILLLTALLVVLVASLTVAYQSAKAALANPVDAIKNE